MPKKIKQSNKQKQSQNVIVHVHNEKKTHRKKRRKKTEQRLPFQHIYQTVLHIPPSFNPDPLGVAETNRKLQENNFLHQVQQEHAHLMAHI
jgi:hypothetical protein